MTDKELQRLNRKELLEILITQKSEIDSLQERIREYEEQSQDREIRIDEAGSIAEAALSLNGVFETAQSAAEQYLSNIRNADSICQEKQEAAQIRADEIVAEAEVKATAMIEEAQSAAQQYWDEISNRLELFYNEHVGLRELLQANASENEAEAEEEGEVNEDDSAGGIPDA